MRLVSAMNEVSNCSFPDSNSERFGVAGVTLPDEAQAPRWIELLPAGDFSGRDGRGPFRVPDAAALIAATNALGMQAGLPIDYDHATDLAAPTGRPAPAAGWIRKLESRDGALWGEVEWTSHGAAAITTHQYRYISPVFEYSQDGTVQRLLRAALTNNPNLYLRAIAARLDKAAGAGETIMDSLEERLRPLLGLNSGATTEEIVDAVRLRVEASRIATNGVPVSGNAADPACYVPVAQFEAVLTELNGMRAASERERAEVRVDAAMRAGKIVPAQREWAIAYCQANLRGFEAFIARQPAFSGTGTEAIAREVSHPSLIVDGIGTGDRRGLELTRAELAICGRLGLQPRDYLKRRHLRSTAAASIDQE